MFEFKPPDWRNASDYSGLLTTSYARLAWEFLRRNADYQKAWSDYCQTLFDFVKGDPELVSYVEYLTSDVRLSSDVERMGGLESLGRLHGRLIGTRYWAIDERFPGPGQRKAPLDRLEGTKWGLDSLRNPNTSSLVLGGVDFTNRGATFRTLNSRGLASLEDQLKGEGQSLEDSRWLVLQIDLSMPLEVIEASMAYAVRAERKFRSKHGDLLPMSVRAQSHKIYVEYLRVFDGFKSGAEVKEIGGVLAPKEKNLAPDWTRDKRLRASKKSATKLVQGDYIALPCFDIFPKYKEK